jgi:nitroimidazol reductase NimA-like FMN-containing flavoprotein (pyridoxamine 5'-phosphate oxidase superfamily)
MSEYARTPRTTLKRLPERGAFDRRLVHGILDEGLVCHVGFVAEGQPFVIPTIYARVEDRVYVHGSAASRMLRALSEGVDVCLTVTLLDGLVLARSAFHHSMNYRSVVALGRARLVTDDAEKRAALDAIVEHVVAGRGRDVRGPSESELKATSVLRLDLVEVSAKVRSGPPTDDEDDLGLKCWAGVIPLRLTPLAPIADACTPADQPVPDEIARYERPGAR